MSTDAKMMDASRRMARITKNLGCTSSEAATLHLGCLVQLALKEAGGSVVGAEQLLLSAVETACKAVGGQAVERLRRNADRYEWLRATEISHNGLAVTRYDWIPDGVKRYLGLPLDCAVDAGMEGKPLP